MVEVIDNWLGDLQATIQARKCLHFGEENMKVQKYSPPEVGAAEPSSANARATHMRNTPHVAHCVQESS
jgi:hypothetical protein